MIDIPVPPLATQTILESYLQVLEVRFTLTLLLFQLFSLTYLFVQAAGQRDLIAMYAGALGDNAIERYALFLVSLELSADMAERRSTLTKAKEHGLDMDRVAVATAELTIEKAFEVRVLTSSLSLRAVY